MRAPTWIVLVALAASPAAGDWLVLRDGTRIETEGPWEVKGRQVVFTAVGGALSALRAADVDLEASTEANREAARPAAAVEARPRKPILVLTDEDLAPPEIAEDAAEDVEEDGDAGEDEDLEEAAEDPAAAVREPVEVLSWGDRDSDGAVGLEIYGRVRNTGDGVAADIRVTVTVPGEEGESPVEARAFLDTSALAPGQATGFRALLPGIFSLSGDPSFDVRSEAFSVRGPGSPSAEGEDETGEGDGLEGRDDLGSGGI